MTREELKEHCLKEIKTCEMWARLKGEDTHGKLYEEHNLILELLEHESRLISVSERLPEDGRPVLIYAWNVHYVVAIYDSFRTENGYKKCWVTADAWNGNTEIKHVIAWMPLPEPMQADKENAK